jgi:murein DD-endopeptidase MepM/ murein hydrolase activator NlpD
VQVTPGTGSAFVARRLAAKLVTQVKVVQGQMDSQSFYSSAVAAGLKDALIPDFFQAFVYDFDFQREIFPGDVFEAAFEQNVNAHGEAVGDLALLYASMVTRAKSRALYRFRPSGATESAWFDGAGKSIRRSLMRTPVEGARISSTFGMRDHPVLGFTRAHKGTDFATPVGTPVFASGAGRITALGLHGDFGNYIAIRHSPTLSTAYAHLSQFRQGLAIGSTVSQGQQIALTGNTGLTSGPHLHYEVLVDGQQVDSQTFQTEEGFALAGADLAAFTKQRDRIDVQRTRTT